MRTLIRSTANIDEYWCNAEKRVISLPKGTIPDFDVTKEPESMLGNNMKEKVKQASNQNEKFIEDMNAKELRAHAAENNITIPFEVKKTEDIRKFILDYKEDLTNTGDDE